MEKQFDYAHDATLTTIEVKWGEGTVRILIETHKGQNEIILSQFQLLSAPRNFDWGESYQINEILVLDGELTIEMQSGDIITIKGILN